MLSELVTTGLIFGGCCTNVFALEQIVKIEPSSGLIITFSQFVLTASFAYLSQVQPGAAYTVRPPKVPLSRWAFIAAMFFAINMLNNWAFAFRISVPVHIILRSFGSVSTMAAGWLRGRRYSALQVFSVVVLTVGVLVSAWADSEGKGKSLAIGSDASAAEFTQGLAILLVAQLMSAYMGAFTEDTYALYKASWTENLFYSHFLSLPLFLPLAGTLRAQYRRLAATPEIGVLRGGWGSAFASLITATTTTNDKDHDHWKRLLTGFESLPRGVVFLLTNAGTQLACISGVNLLSAKSSAVTVTIVLNVRKLVSFVLSTLLFGHVLSAKMILGSALVFGSGALYGWETSWRMPRQRAQREERRARAATQAANAIGKGEGEGRKGQ